MYKSPTDHRLYRYLTLDNKLRVLLIEDHFATRSAAALSVSVGHFFDPKNRNGLAHFLEHMLFLGTEKYPKVGEFQSFISQHGGSNNAWTGTENTTYFFDIQHAFYADAIDRFAQFFTTPLFNKDAVDKERHSVDAEYRLKIKDDVRRIYQVQKETINPLHPFSKFSVGNLDTLADHKHAKIRDDLIDFYQTFYSAKRMTAAFISPLTLDQQETLITRTFSQISNRLPEQSLPDVPFVTDEQRQVFIQVEPIKDIRKLSLAFVLPNDPTLYKTKPLSYIASLIGHEGVGSVMSLLKQKGYINTLSAGGGVVGYNFREFTINLSLTEKGLQHQNEIICDIFKAITLIKEQGVQAWRYKEKQHIQEMHFLYQENLRPINLVSHLVMNMHHYEQSDTLNGDYLMQQYDEALIQKMFSYLTPENLRITLVAKHQHYDQIAKWYDTPYSVTPITEQQKKQWQEVESTDDIVLPAPNPFINENFDALPLEAPEITLPQKIESQSGFSLWHLQETQYVSPKGMLFIAIDSPIAVSSVDNIVKTRISVEMLMEAINEAAYPAEIAGLSYSIYAHQGGVTIKLSGFTEKIPLLLNLVLTRFLNRDFDPSRFDFTKQLLLRGWKNALKDKPINRLYNSLSSIIQPNNPSFEQLIQSLETLSVEALPEFVHDVISQIHIDMFVYGNWQKKQAISLAQSVKKTFMFDQQSHKTSYRPIALLNNTHNIDYHLDCQSQDSAVLVYFQSLAVSPTQTAFFSFAQHLLSSVFYNEIRTKRQLGYLVGSSNLQLNQHAGIIFYVQSPLVGPAKLLDAIDDVLNAFYLTLLELTQEKWQNSKQALINQIEEKDTNLKTKGQRLWFAIGYKDTTFTLRSDVANAIRAMSRTDMIRFVTTQLKPRTANRLIMHTCSPNHLDQQIDSKNRILSVSSFQEKYVKREH